MTANSAPAGSSGSRTALAPGKVVGGRFVVEGTASEDALGVVLAAKDNKTQKPIALRVLRTDLLDGEGLKLLRTECRVAATLSHRNIVSTYGVGSDSGGAAFVACEWIDGAPLSTLIERQKNGARPMSLRGAYNVIAHICKALTYAHEKGSHGALRPSVVWVSRSGRVKLGDFGVGRSVIMASGAASLGPKEQPCLAPEVKGGRPPDARSDIFGIGAILYTLLTGRSPADGFVPPSQAHPDASEAIDRVLLTCLAADPAARYGSPDEVRTALLPLVANAPDVPVGEDLGVDIDIDVDLASQRPPAPNRPLAAPAPTRPMAPPAGPREPAPVQARDSHPDRPQVGHRVSLNEPFRASQPEMPAARVSESVDLASLLAKITERDAPRWMVIKDKLDHGPFTGRELVELILKGDVRGDHGLLNMDSGERKRVREFDEFQEFLHQAEMRRREASAKIKLQKAETVEKASNVFKYLIAFAVVGVVGLGIGLYFVFRPEAHEEQIADAELADLYERGDVELTGTAGILPDPPRRGGGGGGGGRRGGGGGGGGGGGLSYEEAMERAVDIGSAAGGGGEQRLTAGDVQGVMNRNINRFYSCVGAELRQGGSLGSVRIDLAIAGDGSVIGASTRQGSGSFRSCIASRVRSVRFPSFSAPRMGASFSFSVD